MITKKTVYVTTDFSEFDTMREAKEHEAEYQRKHELNLATIQLQINLINIRNNLPLESIRA